MQNYGKNRYCIVLRPIFFAPIKLNVEMSIFIIYYKVLSIRKFQMANPPHKCIVLSDEGAISSR